MDKMHEEEDIREADVIIEDIKKLIDREKAEGEDENEDVKDLEDALAAMERFEADEKSELEESPEQEPSSEKSEPIDTGVLTGPINNLKNFLVKKSQNQY
jgi:hypothetical protein